MLNKGFIILLNNFPNNFVIFVCDKTSIAMKKGSREGMTEFAHNFKPDFAAEILLDEKKIRQTTNDKKTKEMILRFSLNANIYNFFILKHLLYMIMRQGD